MKTSHNRSDQSNPRHSIETDQPVGDQHLRRGNLLWEGSRMFLPEHREQLLAKRRSRQEFRMPELDEDWMTEMGRKLSDAWTNRTPVTIIYGTRYETQQCTGIIRQIDPYGRWIKVLYTAVDDAGAEEPEEPEQQGQPEIQQIAIQRIIDIREA